MKKQTYEEFVDKFVPKKTTDDCYTPRNVYDAVADWVAAEYGLDKGDFVRPFWPGGDYENFAYPEGCVVVDNPPFSILSKICKTYKERGIRFFLFAPSKTPLNLLRERDLCALCCDATVTYENGAQVGTSFVTNLDRFLVRSAPDLSQAVKAADEVNRSKRVVHRPSYVYPDHVITALQVSRWSKYGVDYKLAREDAHFIYAMDSQREAGKTIFGSGFLLSESAAAESAAAERASPRIWCLSDRERDIVRNLGGVAHE